MRLWRTAIERGRRLASSPVAGETYWALALDALNLLIMLLSFTLLGKQLGPAGFGNYAAMYAIIGVLNGLVSTGTSLNVVQLLVRDRLDLQFVLRASLGLVGLLGLLAVVVGTAVAHLTVPGLTVPVLLSFMVAELLGAAAREVLLAGVSAKEGVARAARYRLLPLGTKLGILVGLFSVGHLTIPNLGTAYLLLYPVVTLIIAGIVTQRYSVNVWPGRPVRAHFRRSFLYAVAISAGGLQSDGDKVVMTASRSGPETGLYAAAYRLVMIGMVPLRALLAASHRYFLDHDPEARNQHVRRASKFSAVGLVYGVVFGAALYLCAPLASILLGDDYDGTVTMLRALAPLVAVRACAEFPLNGLLGLGKLGARTATIVGAAVSALAIYVLLIPSLGWKGAVIGTYASEVILGVVAWLSLLHFQRKHDAALKDRSEPAT